VTQGGLQLLIGVDKNWVLPGGRMTLLLSAKLERIDQRNRSSLEIGLKYLF